MNITTAFSPGDRIWCVIWAAENNAHEPQLLTVGQVRVCITDTPGLDLGDGMYWDNFKARQDRVEEYMCIETGIGSGQVYTLGKHAFGSREACIAQIDAIVQQLEREEADRRLQRQLHTAQALLERSPMLEYQGDD